MCRGAMSRLKSCCWDFRHSMDCRVRESHLYRLCPVPAGVGGTLMRGGDTQADLRRAQPLLALPGGSCPALVGVGRGSQDPPAQSSDPAAPAGAVPGLWGGHLLQHCPAAGAAQALPAPPDVPACDHQAAPSRGTIPSPSVPVCVWCHWCVCEAAVPPPIPKK